MLPTPPVTHPRAWGLALAGACTLTCTDDTLEPAALAEVCGQPGPARLLELAPGRRLGAGTIPLRIGDRHVFITAARDPASSEFYVEADVELWSAGPCGEDPRQLLPYVQWISTLHERWPGILVACDGSGLKTVEPADGTVAPFLLTGWCGTSLTEHGLVTQSGTQSAGSSFGALNLHPYPEQPRGEPPPPRTLHPKLRTQILEPLLALPQFLLQVRPDAVFAIDEHNTLVRIDLLDASVTDQASDVFAFEVSADGRHLLWQLTPAPDLVTGFTPVFLKDRDTGTTVALGESSVVEQTEPRILATPGFAVLTLDRRRHTSVVRLSDLSISELPRGYTLAGVIDERDWLLINDIKLNNPGLARFDSATSTLTPLVKPLGDLLSFTTERALYLPRDYASEISEGPVYRLGFSDASSRRVAARATRFAQPHDDRLLLTPVDLDADDRGTLLLVDLATAHEARIDERVPPRSFQLDAGFGPAHIVYSVDDGERSGIYLARLAEP